MLLAAATLTWILTTYTPEGDSTVTFDTEEECEAAQQEYNAQFDRIKQHIENHADCSPSSQDSGK